MSGRQRPVRAAETRLVVVQRAVLVAFWDLGARDNALRSLLQPAHAGFAKLAAFGSADDPHTGTFADWAHKSHNS